MSGPGVARMSNGTRKPLEALGLWDVLFENVYPLIDIPKHPHNHALTSFAFGESESTRALSRLQVSMLLGTSPNIHKLDVESRVPGTKVDL